MQPQEDRPGAAAWIAGALNESVMGLLALLALALALLPGVFDVAPAAGRWLDLVEWAIIALFAAEYGANLALAPRKWAYIRDPWHVLDILIIVCPAIALLPQASDTFRSSPVLRLLRLVRVVLFGARAGGVVTRGADARAAERDRGPLAISLSRTGENPRLSSLDDLRIWVHDPGEGWYHVSNVGPKEVREIAEAAGIPPATVEGSLSGTGYPRIEMTERFSTLFVWLPEVQRRPSGVVVQRTGVVLILNERGLLTLSEGPVSLQQVVAEAYDRLGFPGAPSPARLACAVLKLVLQRNEEISGWLEGALRTMEEIPVPESRPQFLQRAFRLKKEMSAAQADLWRVREMLDGLREGRLTFPGMEAGDHERLRLLYDEADYLYETIVNTREGLLSLIDLHLNVVSFEMNKVMRVLAVVSVLGLLPAVVGGLLGMNLIGNPWNVTLAQVAYGISMGMLLCLYLFLTRGWLR